MYDPAQLRTFLAVAQTLSFTQAAHRLGLRQSTVSQHVRRLEDATGRQLFSRDTHSVELTEDGEAMLGFARTILQAHERASAYFAGTRLRGRLRFGASEDFVLTRLPEILESFRRDHPEVDLELTVELSGTLHKQLEAGRLDLVLAKRRTADDTHGELVWRDHLIWIAAEGVRLDPDRPVPLILFPPPAVTRARALDVLERHGRPWRIACTSGSLSGLVAAARAGLGVMAHTRGLVPPGLVPVPDRAGLPELGTVDFVLLHGRRRSAAQEAADALAGALLAAGDRLHGPAGRRPPGSISGAPRRSAV
ncbi:LysR family transcriptional regulator [Streptomyces lunaelactis]|uniref:LysR substrate-binding domain-containing protein n=2 Tax=Streptomyces lunaelactis TaxID=1535768 RepID=UPI0015857A28|nr:LysR substrate-binding domain-containing protein [Streptomyces lunaelactis]NUK39111.1 LysR family transcriptional regulator [Streptomyces lunaelactis]NUK46245.1 LysR family transcriptional regulator [Streptomyces lunaelactis]NUK96967.1 LysR family transcriptional regulator [Streptomyces lunaelactis]NUL34721.1 LysR family transcriptional regulator [Streptomyces lunaelactis]